MRTLIVIDMQNDFVVGSLANPKAESIAKPIANLIESGRFDRVIATMDCHSLSYLDSLEGKNLPVPHCIEGTVGQELFYPIAMALSKHPSAHILRKRAFGAIHEWGEHAFPIISSDLTIVGTCTDICVLSNAIILKSMFPNTKITVLADYCAGTSEEAHENALRAMAQCQIEVIRSHVAE